MPETDILITEITTREEMDELIRLFNEHAKPRPKRKGGRCGK